MMALNQSSLKTRPSRPYAGQAERHDRQRMIRMLRIRTAVLAGAQRKRL